MNIIMALILSFIAGFSTLIGGLFIYLPIKNSNKIISFSLAFSTIIMLGISIFDLIPSAFKEIGYNPVYLVLIIPLFIISMIIVIVSNNIMNDNNTSLYNLGILSMLILILHNFPEGVLTFLSSSYNMLLGIKLTIAIAFHNIPEGIAIAVPIYYSTGSYKKALMKTFYSSLAEPIGAVLAYIVLGKFMGPMVISLVLVFVSGLMISLAIYSMMPLAINYKEYKSLFLGFTIGILFYLLSLIIL